MKIYLAARYSRREELLGYADELHSIGHEVTSRWLNGSHQISHDGAPIGDDGEALVESGESEKAAKLREHFALEDIEDVKAADLLIAFTEPPRSTASRGGRHVELGYALALGKVVATVGPRENVFCWLPDVKSYETWHRLVLDQKNLEWWVKRSQTSAAA